nr:MAG TPA: Single stranded DNA binding protein [Caudoviricetes sp.]
MSGETLVTLVGNLTADPTLRWTQSGSAVADFTVASTPRTYDRNAGEWRDGDTLFMRCSVWRDVAENVAESLRKGMRVIVVGRLTQRSYETQQGERRTVVELQVDEVGPSLRRARAQVIRHPAADGGAGYPPPPPPASPQPVQTTQQAPQQPAPRQPPTQEDPWARQASQPAANYAAWEPPF